MASFVTAPVPTEFNREIVPSYDRYYLDSLGFDNGYFSVAKLVLDIARLHDTNKIANSMMH